MGGRDISRVPMGQRKGNRPTLRRLFCTTRAKSSACSIFDAFGTQLKTSYTREIIKSQSCGIVKQQIVMNFTIERIGIAQ